MIPKLSICHGHGSKMNFLVSDYIRGDTAYLLLNHLWSKHGPILKILAFLEVFFPKEYENAKAGMNFQYLKSMAPLHLTLLGLSVCILNTRQFKHVPYQYEWTDWKILYWLFKLNISQQTKKVSFLICLKHFWEITHWR